MQNRTPVARSDRPDLPDFAPVPRKYRHDGWTPERQKAFIEALADTGCVSRAAAMVNMAQANCYTLRRAPSAEEFRRAWDAALDFGLQRLKDIAFERAIEGYQVPVFVGGRLMGYRRKTNDALLMFCLRHYGHDAEGRRSTIAYYSAAALAGATTGGAAAATAIAGESATVAATAGAGTDAVAVAGAVAETVAGAGRAVARASATVRTVTRGRGGRWARPGPAGGGDADGDTDRGDVDDRHGAARQDALAQALHAFGGVTLDATAAAAIEAALEACARRRRAGDARIERGGDDGIAQQLDDGQPGLVRVGWRDEQHWGQLEPLHAGDPADAFGDAVLFDGVAGSDGTGMDPRFIHELPWSLSGTDMLDPPGAAPGAPVAEGAAEGEAGDGR
ncbi:hypothetical protein [Sphingomonas sp. CARO-RG-8B-R24-01]|uniref:hypothetical protein n=1 Tax=Sphingomonas sp. CARO-RG-8B-R24-01 TaxID=2914831 RepID=UPI001F55C7B4|nr:hypothetical protein [Sphingomonas sp. CARO-RG-8B-R24-01]